MVKPVVVVDLDGTLYDDGARQHLAQPGLWEEYHAKSIEDPPNEPVLDFLSALPPSVVVVGCTGRNSRHREITERWMINNDVPIDHILMREEGNFLSDAIVKPQLLLEWAGENYPGQALTDLVWVVLEDRDKMVECWRDMGLPCWQVRVASGERS